MKRNKLASIVIGGAIALNLALAGGAAASFAGFSDVDESDYYADAVQWVKEQGITQGCDVGRYCPDEAVSRGQMAVFLKRLADKGPIPILRHTGAPNSHPYYTTSTDNRPVTLAGVTHFPGPGARLYRVVWVASPNMNTGGDYGASCTSNTGGQEAYEPGMHVFVNGAPLYDSAFIRALQDGQPSGGETSFMWAGPAAGTAGAPLSIELRSAPFFCSNPSSVGRVGPITGQISVYDEGPVG